MIDEFEFEDIMSQVFYIDYLEHEGADIRIDCQGFSLWLRGGRVVEGVVPKQYKEKTNAAITQLSLVNKVEYK